MLSIRGEGSVVYKDIQIGETAYDDILINYRLVLVINDMHNV